MDTFISHSAEETAGLGEAWGRAAPAGWLIGLSGDLGAGKTQLVRGLARGLGVTARVHSPTFALIHIYRGGRLPLVHLDLYRLETPAQIRSAGLEPYVLQPTGLTVVEWVERLPELAASALNLPRLRRVRLETLDETQRRITYEDVGA